MRKQAIFDVTIEGASIAGVLAPIMTSITVTDQSGTHGDTAQIELDDRGGQIAMPQAGAKIRVSLGWVGAGLREVFAGTVDEVQSQGGRGGGMTMTILAKGFDATGKAKEGQERHFDDKTVKDIITSAASPAGLAVNVDPQLASIVIDYIEMRGESLLHFGQRLAAMVGGSFRVQGETATLARRASDYTPQVIAARGVNLHDWSVTPFTGRNRYKKTKARYFDKATGQVETVENLVDGEDVSDAEFLRRELAADKDDAERITKADAAVIKERRGMGTVTIEGAPDAIPDGLCVIVGTRPGIDGSYRIKSVTHTLTRGGGYTTSIELAQPPGGDGA